MPDSARTTRCKAELIHAIPDLHDHRTVLYIGASGKQHFMLDEMLAHHQEVVILEMYEPYVMELRRKFPDIRTIHGDLLLLPRHAKDLFQDPRFDLIFWWHGPEHVPEVAPCLAVLYSLFPRLLVVSTPNGPYPQGPIDGNQNQQHRLTFESGYWKALGFEERVFGRSGDMDGNIIAWRRDECR